jgi:hypothetical protein
MKMYDFVTASEKLLAQAFEIDGEGTVHLHTAQKDAFHSHGCP